MNSTETNVFHRRFPAFARVLGGFLLLLTVLASGIHAQPTTTTAAAGSAAAPSEQVFGVGLYASLTDGMGIDFRHHLANTAFSYQVTIGPWKTSTNFLFSAGLDFQYDLSNSNSGRLYACGGYGFYYNGNGHNDLGSPTRFGAGVGYEIPLSSSIAWTVSLMITSFQPGGELLPLPSLGGTVYFK